MAVEGGKSLEGKCVGVAKGTRLAGTMEGGKMMGEMTIEHPSEVEILLQPPAAFWGRELVDLPDVGCGALRVLAR